MGNICCCCFCCMEEETKSIFPAPGFYFLFKLLHLRLGVAVFDCLEEKGSTSEILNFKSIPSKKLICVSIRVLSMGTRTMGSHGGGGSGNGEIQHPKSDGLSKQGLLYNLTLDEVQLQLGDLGKPLSSMNLDELLKSVWTAEAEANQNPGPIDYSQHAQLASTSSMARQSSLTDLSKKAVDELWQDIQKKKETNSTHNIGSNDNSGGSGYNPERKNTHEKQPTVDEMTLKDFLAKAGVVAESSQEKKNMPSVIGPESVTMPQQNVSPQQAPWMQYQIPPIQQAQHVFMPGHHHVQQPLPTTTMDGGYLETQMTMSPLVSDHLARKELHLEMLLRRLLKGGKRE